MHRVATCLITLLAAAALSAQTDTVWPGDANYDGYCNQDDVLVIGMKFGANGLQRDSVSIAWSGQPSYTWVGDTLFNNLTSNYADCNGDGDINHNDLAAVHHNFGLAHDSTLTANGFSSVGATQQDPHLSFDPRGTIDSVFVSDTVIYDVQIGVFGMAAHLTGFAFEASFTSELVDTILVEYDASVLQPSTARLDFDQANQAVGRISASSILTNNTIVNVAGPVVSFIIVMEGNIAGKTGILQDTLVICPEHIVAIDTAGQSLPIFGECDSVIVYDLDSRIPHEPASEFSAYPNPSAGTFTITSKQYPMEEIIIANTLGQIVHRELFSNVREEIIFNLELASGLYALTARRHGQNGLENVSKKLLIINQ